MAPPAHVQALTAIINSLFIVIGLRDIFAPGTPLPMPDDDKLMGIMAVGNDKKSTESFRVLGTRDFLSNMIGCFIVTVSVAKITTVFSHTSEGTFLRRNLLIMWAAADIVTGAVMYKHNDFIVSQFGVPMGVLPFAVMMFLEAGVYLHDALLRERKTKKKK